VATDHIDQQVQLRRSTLLDGELKDDDEIAPDALFVAQKIKMTFKRTEGNSVIGKCWKIVEVPLNFLRDYSVPMADKSEWDRNRAAIIPLTFPWAFAFLNG